MYIIRVPRFSKDSIRVQPGPLELPRRPGFCGLLCWFSQGECQIQPLKPCFGTGSIHGPHIDDDSFLGSYCQKLWMTGTAIVCTKRVARKKIFFQRDMKDLSSFVLSLSYRSTG